jgi:predicted permease
MAPVSESFFVTPDYFTTMGIELLEGSCTAKAEHGDSQQLVLVDETFARMWWPQESPIGKRFQLGQNIDANDTWYHVIGLVPRVSYLGVDREMRETIYFCGSHIATQNFILVVRTQNDPLALVAPIRQAIARIDAAIPVPEVQTLHARLAEQSFLRRTTTGIFGLFSLTALLLTALGIYSVMAYWVAQRIGEIGIRMALGAQSRDILRKVLIQSSRLLGFGLLFGLVGGLVFSQVLSSGLFGVTPLDFGTYLGVVVLLILVTLLACLIPARRATKVDPMEALRYE